MLIKQGVHGSNIFGLKDENYRSRQPLQVSLGSRGKIYVVFDGNSLASLGRGLAQPLFIYTGHIH